MDSGCIEMWSTDPPLWHHPSHPPSRPKNNAFFLIACAYFFDCRLYFFWLQAIFWRAGSLGAAVGHLGPAMNFILRFPVLELFRVYGNRIRVPLAGYFFWLQALFVLNASSCFFWMHAFVFFDCKHLFFWAEMFFLKRCPCVRACVQNIKKVFLI